MWRRGRPVTLAVFLAVILLSPSVYAHEQEILNVILVEDEARPGNVSDSAFVEGNGIVFRMRDNTANASMQIRIDLNQDGLFNGSEDNVSVWLTRSCSLDENGSLVDENCAVSHQIIFGNTSQGVYEYQIERMVENSTSEVWNYSIQVWPDIHEEPGQPSIGDCFGANCEEEGDANAATTDSDLSLESMLYVIMALATLGIILLVMSIRKERLER
tara:strand:- start:2459 stop:3103 length:645 start_codon:yes stop_codon:yes gene_type:complete